MPEPAYLHIRASDRDRQDVVDRLSVALVHGRLDIDEFDQRAALAYQAQTTADLATLTRDLPGHLW